MMGKMELVPQFRHDNKASQVRMQNGTEKMSVQGQAGPDAPLVWTRVIRLK